PETPPDPAPAAGPLISADPTPASGWTTVTPPAVSEVAPGLVIADVASRLVAFVIDIFLVALISSIVGTVLGMGRSITTEGDLGLLAAGYDYTILTVAIGLLYFVASWTGGRRATLGQRAFSLQVGNAFDGQPLTLEQAVRRWLGYGHFFVLFTFDATIAGISGLAQLVWVIALLVSTVTSPTGQGIHDRLANTAVVRPTTAGKGVAVTCLVIVVVGVVLAVVGFAAFISSDAGREILQRAMDRI
ncbi:MAG: RDD family protein, partial [Candidatus Limnocylindrales bacterium]